MNAALIRAVGSLGLLLCAQAAVCNADPKPPEVVTGAAGSLGTDGFTANGRIQPHGLPTRYWFEYGPTAERGQKSPALPLPARLAAHYRETWNEGLAGWKGGMSGADLVHHPADGGAKGFVRFREPSGDDPNHIDGIGILHLTKYFYPGTYAAHPWGGGDPDLRDARIRIRLRGNRWIGNGSELVWWTQSDLDLATQHTADWRRANWAYTGFSLTPFLASGNWETVEYQLKNDSEHWTYAGNNLAQNRPNYVYWSIDRSQGRLNCDFFHLLAFINPSNRPQGSIDFDELEITYRNHSVLLPSNGGRLTSAPGDDLHAAAALTDGWRSGPGREWTSAASPKVPQEFLWQLDHPVTVTAVQVHQHSLWPAKDVEVLLSVDGETWAGALQAPLPDRSPEGMNFAFALKRDLGLPARFVKVRILSGYKTDHWGLGEVELQGTGAVEGTDDDWYHVNQDLTGLNAGQTYYYRLAASSAQGTYYGEPQTFTVPSTSAPLATTGVADRIGPDRVRLTGRLNAMGQRTQFHFEYGLTADLGNRTETVYGGLQITPRHAQAELAGLKPDSVYFFRLVAKSEAGETRAETLTFRTAKAR